MFQFSKHFKEQIELRNINLKEAKDAISNPFHIVQEDGLTVYEKLIYRNDKQYLIRIFVNELKQPPIVVTGYITSKIKKYLHK